MITNEEFKKALAIVLEYESQIKKEIKEIEALKTTSTPTFKYLRDNDEISGRTFNCLQFIFHPINDKKISILNNFDVNKLIEQRNFGYTSMYEIQFICKKYKIMLSSKKKLRSTKGIKLQEFSDIINVV